MRNQESDEEDGKTNETGGRISPEKVEVSKSGNKKGSGGDKRQKEWNRDFEKEKCNETGSGEPNDRLSDWYEDKDKCWYEAIRKAREKGDGGDRKRSTLSKEISNDSENEGATLAYMSCESELEKSTYKKQKKKKVRIWERRKTQDIIRMR